jgi:SET domain-containing protein
MALLEKHLYVKKSTIPNAGKGLFTKVFIPKGTRIIEYKGKISTWKEVQDDDGKNGYIFFVNRNHVINAQSDTTALARYANDANGLVKVKGVRNNAEYETEGKKAYIVSKKDIEAKSEIFVDYGDDYWKVIRKNIKLWAKEEKEAKAKAEKAAKEKAKKAAKAAKEKVAKAKKTKTAKKAKKTTTVKRKAVKKKA